MMHSLIVPYKDEKEECRDILERIGQSQLAHPDSTVCVFSFLQTKVTFLLMKSFQQNPNMKNEMRDYENRDRTGE